MGKMHLFLGLVALISPAISDVNDPIKSTPTLKCYKCDDCSGELGKEDLQPCSAEFPYGLKEQCFSIRRVDGDNLKLRKGCLYDLAAKDQEACLKSKTCEMCDSEDGCNKDVVITSTQPEWTTNPTSTSEINETIDKSTTTELEVFSETDETTNEQEPTTEVSPDADTTTTEPEETIDANSTTTEPEETIDADTTTTELEETIDADTTTTKPEETIDADTTTTEPEETIVAEPEEAIDGDTTTTEPEMTTDNTITTESEDTTDSKATAAVFVTNENDEIDKNTKTYPQVTSKTEETTRGPEPTKEPSKEDFECMVCRSDKADQRDCALKLEGDLRHKYKAKCEVTPISDEDKACYVDRRPDGVVFRDCISSARALVYKINEKSCDVEGATCNFCKTQNCNSMEPRNSGIGLQAFGVLVAFITVFVMKYV